MASLNDIRSNISGVLCEERARHRAVRSPLVPRNDPTLMFVNSGMVPFKNVFTGLETRDYARADHVTKNVCGPAVSTTTSTMSATRRAIIRSLRCWGIFSFGDYFKEARHPARVGA